MWPILPRLYLGDQQDARDRTLLRARRITHVLNCAFEVPCYFPRRIQYLHLGLADPDYAFAERIPEICEFLDSARRTGRALVHCHMGISRSPSAILAYLRHRGHSLDEAVALLRTGVGEEEDEFHLPHEAFLDQIREYFDSPSDP